MSDSTDPRWAPPGDADPGPGRTDDEGHHDTAQLSSEQTQQIARTEAPPPPPPPHVVGGWAPPPSPPDGPVGYGPGGWQPPAAPRRRTGLVVGIVLGVVALVTALGAGVVLLVRASDGGPMPVPQPGVPDEQAVPDDAPRPGGDVPADDLVAQAEAVLQTVNQSEERMIAFQDVVFEAIGEDGSVGDAAAEVARAAQSAGDDLTGLRTRLQGFAGGDGEGFDGLRDIRDTYATHMEAWIEYLDAVAGSPALAAPDSPDAQPFWRDIELTGDDFVTAVETGLPPDVPASLEELARLIVERGFGGFDSGPSGDVV